MFIMGREAVNSGVTDVASHERNDDSETEHKMMDCTLFCLLCCS